MGIVTGHDNRKVQEAAGLCNDLLQAVMEEADQFSQEQRRDRRGKGKGKKGDSKGDRDRDRKGKGDRKGKDDKGDRKGKGKGKRDLEEGETEEIVPVPADDVGDDYPLRAKLVGENGQNVKHIES